jgi:hypothetical protein
MNHIRPYPNDGRYLVSALGQVFSTINGIELKQSHAHKGGYASVGLGRDNTRMVHQLVAETFHGDRPEGMDVAHYDGNPANNFAGNLSYKTRSENCLDRSRHDRCKISNETVAMIRSEYATGISKNETARRFPDVSRSQVRNILNNKWRI